MNGIKRLECLPCPGTQCPVAKGLTKAAVYSCCSNPTHFHRFQWDGSPWGPQGAICTATEEALGFPSREGFPWVDYFSTLWWWPFSMHGTRHVPAWDMTSRVFIISWKWPSCLGHLLKQSPSVSIGILLHFQWGQVNGWQLASRDVSVFIKGRSY